MGDLRSFDIAIVGNNDSEVAMNVLRERQQRTSQQCEYHSFSLGCAKIAALHRHTAKR